MSSRLIQSKGPEPANPEGRPVENGSRVSGDSVLLEGFILRQVSHNSTWIHCLAGKNKIQLKKNLVVYYRFKSPGTLKLIWRKSEPHWLIIGWMHKHGRAPVRAKVSWRHGWWRISWPNNCSRKRCKGVNGCWRGTRHGQSRAYRASWGLKVWVTIVRHVESRK